MTIAAVLTVAVSLTLVGAALLLRQGAANASGAVGARHRRSRCGWSRNANTQEIHAVGTQLAQLNYVRQPCVYWNKARNFAEAKKLLPSDVIQGTNGVRSSRPRTGARRWR